MTKANVNVCREAGLSGIWHKWDKSILPILYFSINSHFIFGGKIKSKICQWSLIILQLCYYNALLLKEKNVKEKSLPLKGISARVDEVSLLGASVCTTISTLSLVVSGVVSVVVVCKNFKNISLPIPYSWEY